MWTLGLLIFVLCGLALVLAFVPSLHCGLLWELATRKHAWVYHLGTLGRKMGSPPSLCISFLLASGRILVRLVVQQKLSQGGWWFVFLSYGQFPQSHSMFLYGLADRKLRATSEVHVQQNICLWLNFTILLLMFALSLFPFPFNFLKKYFCISGCIGS